MDDSFLLIDSSLRSLVRLRLWHHVVQLRALVLVQLPILLGALGGCCTGRSVRSWHLLHFWFIWVGGATSATWLNRWWWLRISLRWSQLLAWLHQLRWLKATWRNRRALCNSDTSICATVNGWSLHGFIVLVSHSALSLLHIPTGHLDVALTAWSTVALKPLLLRDKHRRARCRSLAWRCIHH